ncbi:beta-ketoacyl synthase N-terminal-like domain-containing protein [Streptomyces sp. NPDC001401]|uniref:beta-ketoacyl synthase N-terminal-like domain-containing protein n=1 Tax=Streptomyces sp. NPDC001401 TaxID=3364570 RepID=UPI0036CEE1D1
MAHLAVGPGECVVTGVGAVSPAGIGSAPLWETVSGGRVATGPVTRFDTSRYPARNAGEVPLSCLPQLDRLVPRHPSRAARYLAAATAEAVQDAALVPSRTPGRTGVFVGTVMGTRPLLERGLDDTGLTPVGTEWAEPERLLDLVPAVVTVDGPMVLLASGCSVGGDAVSRGAAAIAAGEVEVAVCGGAEELSQEVFAMFTALRALAPDVARPFDADRRGMLPAEGAGVVVLESAEHCAARGGRARAVLLGHASAADAFHLTQPRPTGDALIEALTTCLKDAGRTADQVDWVCAHGTGTPASDGVEARAIATALGTPARQPVVSSLKGSLGHTQGAAAALETVVAVQALTAGRIPGNATLRRPDPACADVDLVPPQGRTAPVDLVASLAFGLGGGVSALVLSAPKGRGAASICGSAAGRDQPQQTRSGPTANIRITALGVSLIPVQPAPQDPRTDDETQHALAAVTSALHGLNMPEGSQTGTVWAGSTAGLQEFAQTCADIPVLGPARVLPRRAARSAFTGPVTAVSVRYGFQGPYLNLTGAQDAGAHAVAEAVRMLQQDQCARVLVGGSALRSGGADRSGGAACVVLERDPGGDAGTAVRLLHRARVGADPAPFIGDCLERMTGPPRRVVLSAAPGSHTPAPLVSRLCGAPCLDVESRWGDLGAAGGFAALAAAAAMTARRGGAANPRVLVLAVGAGNAVAIEVISQKSSGKGEVGNGSDRAAAGHAPGGR